MNMDEKNLSINSYLDWSDKGKAGFWRYALGLVILFVIFFLLSALFGIMPLTLFVPNYGTTLLGSFIGILATFILSFVATPAVSRLFHQRPFWSVAMPEWRFRAWDFWTAFWVGTVSAVVFGLLFSVLGLLPARPNPDFNLTTFLILIVVAFVGIFIQAGSEEMLFRGYTAQFVRRFSSSRSLLLGIPALIFALPHIANISNTVSGGVFVALPYIISGLLLGWAAYRSGSLWMSLGLHLANNYSNAVLLGTKGDILPSGAPFIVDIPNNLPLLTLIIGIQSVTMALVLNYLLSQREKSH